MIVKSVLWGKRSNLAYWSLLSTFQYTFEMLPPETEQDQFGVRFVDYKNSMPTMLFVWETL